MHCQWKITRANGSYTWTKIDVDGDARLEVFTSGPYATFEEALAAVKRYGYASETGSHVLMFENQENAEKKIG